MEKQHQNSEQPTGGTEPEVQKQENKPIIEGETKKCPYCGEVLPAKIAFCLYCMNLLVGDTAQKSETKPKPQDNGGNRLQKKSAKLLIGAAATLIVIAIVVITSFVTAHILFRQGNGLHYQPPIATPIIPPDASADSPIFPVPTPTPTPTHPQPPTENIIIPDNITPRRPARRGGPDNPPISAQRAVELARDYLISIGVTYARFDYVYMDRERGTWVWSVEFDGHGGSYEFYIDVNTGHIVEFEWDD